MPVDNGMKAFWRGGGYVGFDSGTRDGRSGCRTVPACCVPSAGVIYTHWYH